MSADLEGIKGLRRLAVTRMAIGCTKGLKKAMPYQDFKYTDLTRRIIGCAMKVHSYLGPGYPEIIYKRCLVIELDRAGMKYACEVARDIYYEQHWVGQRRLDLLIENLVVVEIKAIRELKNEDYNQVFNLLNVFDLEVSLLINFGKPSLEFRRFVNSKKSNQSI